MACFCSWQTIRSAVAYGSFPLRGAAAPASAGVHSGGGIGERLPSSRP